MPNNQIAKVSSYPFGCPSAYSAEGELVFRARIGGVVEMMFCNNEGDEDLTVAVQVSTDGVTWAATTAQNNGQAVTDVVVKAKTKSIAYTLNIRPTVDNYVRVRGKGRVPAELQMRGGDVAALELLP